VVLVISVLSGVTLSVLNTAGLRQKAKDSQRISDLGKTQTALELYFADNRAYPILEAWSGIEDLGATLVPNYLSVIPQEPNNNGASPCELSDDGYYYSYRSDATGGKYVLTARMELAASATKSACSSLGNWSALSCGAIPSDVNCYGVQNP